MALLPPATRNGVAVLGVERVCGGHPQSSPAHTEVSDGSSRWRSGRNPSGQRGAGRHGASSEPRGTW